MRSVRFHDDSPLVSHAFLEKAVGTFDREELEAAFSVKPHVYPTLAPLYLLEFLSGTQRIAAVRLTPRGGVELEFFDNQNYPHTLNFPGFNSFPRRLPDYPASTVHPRGPSRRFPTLGGFPVSYPAADFTGQIYPENAGERRVAFKESSGAIGIRCLVRDPGTRNGQIELFVDRYGSTSRTIFATSLDWKALDGGGLDIGGIDKVRIGCVTTVVGDNPYDLTFTNIRVDGDVTDDDWYWIKGYQGFRVDPADADVAWVGVGHPDDDPSDETHLANLARFDYAKPMEALTGTAYGLRWNL